MGREATLGRDTVVAVAVALAALPALASPQSLAEVAERDKARRRTSNSSPRVFTNDDLSRTKGRLANDPGPSPLATPEPRRPSPPPVPLPGETSVGLGDPRDFAPPAARSELAVKEAFWRGEGQRRRTRVAQAQHEVRGAERVSCPITRGRLRKQAQEDLARAQESLADLEDDARRAGALPGWIRE
jgi:hypothetical protein